MRLILTIVSMITFTAFAGGCASRPINKDAETAKTALQSTNAPLFDSSIDIAYVLGHSHRRFVAWAKNEAFGGQTLLDHQILRESGIERGRYSEFFGKVEQFVNTPKRKSADQAVAGQQLAPPQSDDACRTPFTVTLRVGTDTRVVQGCRGADDGSLSHLVRDGEFLLYSNK